jgi:hypothetical protein
MMYFQHGSHTREVVERTLLVRGGERSRRPKVLRVALPGLTPVGFLDYCRMLYSK